MAFTGKLDQFKLPDLLQILATTGKSGKLGLSRRESQGVVVLRNGRIIYAATDSARETLGNLLLHQKLVTQEQLLQALDVQQRSSEELRLGNILVDGGAIDQDTLHRVIRQQIRRVLGEMMEWTKGFFRFDLMDVADHGEIEVDAKDFLLQHGVSADKVLLDIAAAELAREEEKAAEPAPAPPAPAEPPAEVAAEEERLSSLRTVMREIRSPEFTGEVTLRILSYAAEVVHRGVLFTLRREHFCGMGQFGVQASDRSPDDLVREIKLPLDEPSILAEVADSKTPYRGPLADLPWNAHLVESLGGHQPNEVVALPLVVNSSVLLVLYGDNAPGGPPIGPITELEVLMLQAGLAMEKGLLEKRIEQFKKLRSESLSTEDTAAG